MIASESISRLSRALQSLRAGAGDGTADVVSWLRALAPAFAGMARPAAHDARRGYSRTLLHRSDGFEILAMHWEANAVTPVHDHGGSRCWFAVAQGVVGIENYLRSDAGTTPGYARIELEGREDLERGGIDYRQDDVHLHRCLTHEAPAISLHVYAKPLGEFLQFDERAGVCTPCSSSYDAIMP